MKDLKFIIPQYAEEIIQKLENSGFEAYAVGGCVRDMLLGRVPSDFDVCTNALPHQMLDVFKDYKVIETGLKHGTITVVNRNNNIEVTTYRIDGTYLDNRHPENVEFTSNLREDLVRRDFTINAMVYSPTKGVVDYFGGTEDINNKIIRCVGNPDERFNEDALRIMRAIRFSSVLGFDIENSTKDSIFKNTHLLSNISCERKAGELNKLLLGKDACRILFDYTSVICFLIPPLTDCVGLDQKSPHHIYDIYTHTIEALRVSKCNLYVRLALLLHDIGKPVCMTIDENGRGHFRGHPDISSKMAKEILTGLKYDNDTIKIVTTLVKYHDCELALTQKYARRMLNILSEPVLRMLLNVMRADRFAHTKSSVKERINEINEFEKLVDFVIEDKQCFSLKQMEIGGKDLIALGLKPGCRIGQILDTLLNEVIDETIPNNNKALTERAKQLINQSEV